MTDENILIDRWFPVARGEEIVPRHVVQAQLLGQEIAVWRDDSGLVNGWENRCPHRGVRLSIGINTGAALHCQYHGWRYASGTGQCTFIPAHPNQKPSGVIKATPYGVCERYGFVWINLAGQEGAARIPALGLDSITTLRSIFVEAPAALVAERLLEEHGFTPSMIDASILESERQSAKTLVFLQPLNSCQSVIHSLIDGQVPAADRLALLRAHNGRLSDIRDSVEREAA